jgi:hypothetical protein
MPGNTSSWQGTVNANITTSASESYTIKWYDASGVLHSYDPIIQVNPAK